MEIYNNDALTVNFDKINIGEVFESDHEFFIKTAYYVIPSDNMEFNVVSLGSALPAYFYLDDEVISYPNAALVTNIRNIEKGV